MQAAESPKVPLEGADGVVAPEDTRLSRAYPLLEDVSGLEPKRFQAASILIEVVSNALSLGTECHYLGSSDRLREVTTVLKMTGRALRMQDWRTPPFAMIGRKCREAFPEVLNSPSLLMAALGLVCLPPGLSDRILHRPRDQLLLIVVDGVRATDPDVHLALQAVSSYCKRSGVTLAIFP
jgi:hypothetical protein